nr:sodium-dependent transporter [Cohnella kolymensis]
MARIVTTAGCMGFTYYVLYKGVKKGIEKLNVIFMPILWVIMILFVIRAVTLEGAAEGLNHLFTPDFAKILPGFLGGTNPEWYSVWIAAYGQIFFSLSVAFAIMITYSSYMNKKMEVNNSGFIMAFSNSGFEFLAAIGVFAAIGFMAATSGSDVKDVAAAGVGLAFVVFPKIINAFPGMNGFFGALFFLSLIIAGFTSLVSIIEVLIAAVMDKFRMTRKAAVNWVVGICAFVSLIYVTGAGLVVLDIVDHFINSFGIVISGLLEVLMLGWLYKLSRIREENNLVSDYRIGAWWDVMIKFVTPLFLLFMTYKNFELEFSKAYEGYPDHALLTFGWGSLILSVIACVILTYGFSWHKEPHEREVFKA